MNELRIRATGEIITERDFRLSSESVYPDPLDLATMEAAGVDPVLPAPMPQAGEFQRVEREGARMDELGNWVQVWKVTQWEADEIQSALQGARRAKEMEINSWRAVANLTTFPYAGKLVACDSLSRSDIDGVANHINLLGAFPPDFPGGWLATDNSYIPLPTIADFKAMYSAMAKQGTANFTRSQVLKARARAAATMAAIAAIQWIETTEKPA